MHCHCTSHCHFGQLIKNSLVNILLQMNSFFLLHSLTTCFSSSALAENVERFLIIQLNVHLFSFSEEQWQGRCCAGSSRVQGSTVGHTMHHYAKWIIAHDMMMMALHYILPTAVTFISFHSCFCQFCLFSLLLPEHQLVHGALWVPCSVWTNDEKEQTVKVAAPKRQSVLGRYNRWTVYQFLLNSAVTTAVSNWSVS